MVGEINFNINNRKHTIILLKLQIFCKQQHPPTIILLK